MAEAGKADVEAAGWERWRGRILIGMGLAVVLWLGVYFGGGYPPDLRRAADLGTALGPLATLATAAALVVGFLSLRVQREELRLQRDELKLQREQMAASTKELARTARAQQDLADAQRLGTAAQRRANTVSAAHLITLIHATRAEHAAFFSMSLNRHLSAEMDDLVVSARHLLHRDAEAVASDEEDPEAP